MCIHRTELRAFPRLSCATPATLKIEGIEQQVSQIIDISFAGCKVLPSQLEALVEHEYPPGTELTVEVGGLVITGRLAWATPNFSALGCAFDEAITQPLLDVIAGKMLAAAE